MTEKAPKVKRAVAFEFVRKERDPTPVLIYKGKELPLTKEAKPKPVTSIHWGGLNEMARSWQDRDLLEKFEESREITWYTGEVNGITVRLSEYSRLEISGRVSVLNKSPVLTGNPVFSLYLSEIKVEYLDIYNGLFLNVVKIDAKNVTIMENSNLENCNIDAEYSQLRNAVLIHVSVHSAKRFDVTDSELRGHQFSGWNSIKLREFHSTNYGDTHGIYFDNYEGPVGISNISLKGKLSNNIKGILGALAPCNIAVHHPTHIGYFTGARMVPFVRLENNLLLLNAETILNQQELEDILRCIGSKEKAVKQDKVFGAFIGDDRRIVQSTDGVLDEEFKDFVTAMLSRVKLFKLLSVYNKD